MVRQAFSFVKTSFAVRPLQYEPVIRFRYGSVTRFYGELISFRHGSFLWDCNCCDVPTKWVYQCPCSGASHFYVVCSNRTGHGRACINALTRARLISTASRKSGTEFISFKCINALTRAQLISTVPFVTPCKIRGLQACFCTLFTEYSELCIFNTFVTFSLEAWYKKGRLLKTIVSFLPVYARRSHIDNHIFKSTGTEDGQSAVIYTWFVIKEAQHSFCRLCSVKPSKTKLRAFT